MFVHVVVFWFNDSATEEQKRAVVRDCEDLLRRVPTVRQLHAGRPAGTSRDIVDNTYDVGLAVVFDDRAGHDIYQDHPLHHQFVVRHKNLWKRIAVYDFA